MTKRRYAITVLTLLAAAVVTILGAGVIRKAQMDASSREFAVNITSMILTDGAEVLQSHANSELLQQLSNENLTKYIQFVSRQMGELQLIESLSGSSQVPLFIFSADIPTASYDLDVVFAFGPATVKLTLVYDMKEWLISAFVVEAPQLMD